MKIILNFNKSDSLTALSLLRASGWQPYRGRRARPRLPGPQQPGSLIWRLGGPEPATGVRSGETVALERGQSHVTMYYVVVASSILKPFLASQ